MNRTNAILTVLALLSALGGFLLSRAATTPVVDVPEAAASVDLQQPTLIEMTGSRRPDFELADLSGRLRSIGEWDGKVIAVNFWASWCAPCLQEIPELVDLQTRYGADGLQVVGIALQKPEELGEFVIEYKMNYPVMAAETPVIEIAESFGNMIGALPYTAIVDRHGTIVYVKAGPVTGAEVEAVITPLL